jgi:hypothetical protein
MTEKEWLESTHPQKLLEYLRGKTSERKLRLFAVACCRRIWHLLNDPESRQAVEVAEQFADGRAERHQLRLAHYLAGIYPTNQANEAARLAAAEAIDLSNLLKVVAASNETVEGQAVLQFLNMFDAPVDSETRASAGRAGQCELLREMFGNPFQPLAINPVWQTLNVRSVAQVIYEEQTFEQMPVLGDALEDAGCDNADILGHLHGSGTHARGCWVLDLILGKQ